MHLAGRKSPKRNPVDVLAARHKRKVFGERLKAQPDILDGVVTVTKGTMGSGAPAALGNFRRIRDTSGHIPAYFSRKRVTVARVVLEKNVSFQFADHVQGYPLVRSDFL